MLATAMLHFYERMCPRRHSDPAAHPDSAKKAVQSVVRTHRVRSIHMVSLECWFKKNMPGAVFLEGLGYIFSTARSRRDHYLVCTRLATAAQVVVGSHCICSFATLAASFYVATSLYCSSGS